MGGLVQATTGRKCQAFPDSSTYGVARFAANHAIGSPSNHWWLIALGDRLQDVGD